MAVLFIVNTPLQLVTAYIIANYYFKGMDNHILLINPRYEELYKNCFYVKQILDDRNTWQQVSMYRTWLGRETRLANVRKAISEMRSVLFRGRNNIDQVFLGSDKVIQNQILVELSGNIHYNRLEDGVWTYYCPDRHWASKVWHLLRIKVIRALGDLHLPMEYNLGGLGHGKAAIADYVYKPQLLERVSPKPIALHAEIIDQGLSNLKKNKDYERQIGDNAVLLLGSLMVEYHKVTEKEELAVFQTVYELCKSMNLNLVYKPHPAEHTEKLSRYQKAIPKLTYCDIREPIEILYYKHAQIRYVLAHSSSALLFADLFSQGRVKAVSLYPLYGNQENEDEVLTRMMEKSGVLIPHHIEELKEILDFY